MFKSIHHAKKLPEILSSEITEAILGGELAPGQPLPTENQLAEQFEVSRSVVRDAVKMLAARGLVEIIHGKGTFVTAVNNNAFSDSMLLALRRAGGSAWDVEQSNVIILAEICALASVNSSNQQKSLIRAAGDSYVHHIESGTKTADDTIFLEKARKLFKEFFLCIASASNNILLHMLTGVLLDLRNFRDIQSDTDGKHDQNLENTLIDIEKRVIDEIVEGIESGSPERARKNYLQFFQLSPEMISAFKSVPAGEKVPIPERVFFHSMIKGQ